MAVADGSPEDSGGGSPGVWGSWGPWSACSRSCSGGVMEQTRPCLPSSYRGRGGSRPSGPTLPFAGHVVSAVRTSVPLHRSREEQRALVASSDASRPGPTVVRGSRHPQSRGREPSERRYVCVRRGPRVCPCLGPQWSHCLRSAEWEEFLPSPLMCINVPVEASGDHRTASGVTLQAESTLWFFERKKKKNVPNSWLW